MTGVGVSELFSVLKEDELDLYIEMGNDAKSQAASHGIVTFQRESENPLMVKDVLYVPGLTKKLILVSALEDKGYMVTFQAGKVYIWP
jgi:hypothetical protein